MTLNKDTSPSFKGQHFFIGLDVHKKNWAVTIRLQKITLKKFSMDPSPEQLYKYLTIHYPDGVYHSVYEAGFCGYWIHRRLVELGIDNIIVNAADIPTSHKEKDRRQDKIDSAKLARELENDSLKCIYIPTKRQQSLKSLSRLRYQHVVHQTRIKNRIKSFLHFHGIPIPGNFAQSYWSGAFIYWLKTIRFEYDGDNEYLNHYIKTLEYQRESLKHLLIKIREYCKSNTVIRYILSAPGIGIVSAFTFYAELVDMIRFNNFDQLVSYVGLVPSTDSTGEKDVEKGLTPRYSRYVRSLLVECAWRAVRTDPALTLAFAKLSKRMSKQKAIIRIAKKLLNRIRYVWLNQKMYVPAVMK